MGRILCLFLCLMAYSDNVQDFLLIHQNAKCLLLSAEIRRDILEGKQETGGKRLFPLEIMTV